MKRLINKTYNTYKMVNGYISGWERSPTLVNGHTVTMLDEDEQIFTFPWRMPSEPKAGQKISLIMVEEGASLRPDHPVMILNHDTGEVFREPNAPQPMGSKRIMIALSFWMGFAILISAALLTVATGLMFNVITLTAAAFLVWRLAIATSDLNADERAMKRLKEEEELLLEVMTSAWRLANDKVFELTRMSSHPHLQAVQDI